MRRKTVKRRAVRYGLLGVNVIILVIIFAAVLHNPQANGSTSSGILSNQSENGAIANPLDQVSSADIALTVARMNGLPETTAITNQAQSQAAEVTTASSQDNVVAKPQVVATALKSRADIQEYTTVTGDTVASVAAKYGVTSDSIRWSNNFSGDGVPIGVAILIPPVNGIVYTVKAGDTADSLAAKYSANRDQILAYNDGEISGLRVGERIIIPNATQSSAAAVATGGSSSSFSWGGGAPIYGGSNGYDRGYCTWYVASVLPVPNNWGNANTWDNLARVSGWTVSSTPRPGAVGQSNSGYYGHVVYVIDVRADGYIKYSDMNGLAGFGKVGTSGYVPPSKFQNYIYR